MCSTGETVRANTGFFTLMTARTTIMQNSVAVHRAFDITS